MAEIHADGATGIMNLRFREIPETFPILVGEIIYNLRAALDYLIFELSLLDSGNEINGSIPQFIIEDEPTGWSNHHQPIPSFTPHIIICLL